MSLETVKTLTGVDNEQITAIYTMYEKRLFRRLEQSLLEVVEIPEELEYILTECTIARFNRIGSEGMESESMDGHTAKYVDKDISDYEHEIQAYIDSQVIVPPAKGVVKFLLELTNLLLSSRMAKKNTTTTQAITWSLTTF